MKYITNINTLSVLLDRLIVENIKLYFFTKDNLSENVLHQNDIINEIKNKISEILIKTYESKQYDYIEEKRTYKYNAIIETVEELIKSNITTGQADKQNLTEALSDNPSIDKFKLNHNYKKIPYLPIFSFMICSAKTSGRINSTSKLFCFFLLPFCASIFFCYSWLP